MIRSCSPISRRADRKSGRYVLLKELGAALLTLYALTGCVTTTGAFEAAMSGTSDIVDLTRPMSAKMPAPDGIPFEMVAVRTIDKDGASLDRLSMSEGSGTNIEAPARLVVGTTPVDKLPPALLMGYGAVIDVTKAAAQKPDYQVTRSDLETWESENGPIPAEAIVLIRTGWGDRWATPDSYVNAGPDGKAVYPGISADAVDYLVRERRVHALGIDTPSLYAGCGDAPGQRGFLNTGKYHINNLANLDQLPARGSFVLAFPMKVQGAGGAPARVLAIMPQKKTEVEPGKKKVQQSTGAGMGPDGSGSPGGSQRPY